MDSSIDLDLSFYMQMIYFIEIQKDTFFTTYQLAVSLISYVFPFTVFQTMINLCVCNRMRQP